MLAETDLGPANNSLERTGDAAPDARDNRDVGYSLDRLRKRTPAAQLAAVRQMLHPNRSLITTWTLA